MSLFVLVAQTRWTAAPRTVTGTGSAWPDTATASLASWGPTVPKVRGDGIVIPAKHHVPLDAPILKPITSLFVKLATGK